MPDERISLRHSELVLTDGVAEFTHGRPSQRNALSHELRQDYADMIERVGSDQSIRALIITGSGGSFCAGGDLKGVQARMSATDPEDHPALAMRGNLTDGHAWLDSLRHLNLPVIAAVDGAAYGAGMSLALSADFILASDRAQFCMSFARIGLIPDMGAMHMLPRLVGMAAARELFLTARRVGAAEAMSLGFVHAVTGVEDLPAEARQFARRFRNAPRSAVEVTKRLLNMSFETPFGTLAQLEANAQAVQTCTPYHMQAVARFLRGEPALYDWDRGAEQ
jgi:2-(1,2-epoxy-1,2-dihydrophenyl)acetyl-CoA isomerase